MVRHLCLKVHGVLSHPRPPGVVMAVAAGAAAILSWRQMVVATVAATGPRAAGGASQKLRLTRPPEASAAATGAPAAAWRGAPRRLVEVLQKWTAPQPWAPASRAAQAARAARLCSPQHPPHGGRARHTRRATTRRAAPLRSPAWCRRRGAVRRRSAASWAPRACQAPRGGALRAAVHEASSPLYLSRLRVCFVFAPPCGSRGGL